jgi:precorrin-2 dehydrogenase/sirohydrochlorin ferrochelatase
VIAPQATEELQRLAAQGTIRWERRPAGPEDLAGAWLVICAADDAATNESLGRAALQAGVLVNVVDRPEFCNFYVPATVRRGLVSVAISTDGASPLLARRLREQLEEVLGPEYGELAELLARLRKEVQERVPEVAARMQTWAALDLEPVLEKLRTGQAQEAEALVRAHLASPVRTEEDD